MKRIVLLSLLPTLALISIGCTGSQEIVEPSRENFNTGEVKVHELGSPKGSGAEDED